jgi:hypothetical protein
VRDGPGFAGGGTGGWLRLVTGFAGSAMVSDLLSFLMPYKCDGYLPEDVKFIRTDFQNLFRTDPHALSATIAFVCVQSEIPISGTILKTVISNHLFS